jgi:signal transduction histidine kinase
MCAVFEVCTSGMQLAEADIPNMFLPFYQSSEGSISNTGLQLSVVKEIAELHKGQVAVHMNGQTGTCFSVKLPLIRMTEVPVA